MFLYNGDKNNGNSSNIDPCHIIIIIGIVGGIMRTPQQQKNQEKWLRQKAKVIKYLNENEIIVFFLLGLCFLVMVGALAVAIA